MANQFQKQTFKPIPLEVYDTPALGVVLRPLLRVLSDETKFCDPCAGNGEMSRHLQAFGHRCMGLTDISPRHTSILTLDAMRAKPKYTVITNPPFSLVPELLTQWLKTAPSVWLLHPVGFLCNLKTLAGHIEQITDVIPLGRLKWVPGSASSGVIDFVWARYSTFDSDGRLKWHKREKASLR